MSYEREYVERHLGEPLTLALTDICLKRPRDPILYLGQWLLHWQRNKELLLVRRRELEELLLERQKLAELQLEMEAELETEKTAIDEKENEYIVDESVADGQESTGSAEQSGNQESWLLDRDKIEAHVPVDIPEVEPIINKKLHAVTSPIFETDEEHVEEKLMESGGKSEKRDSGKPVSDRQSESRVSETHAKDRRTSDRRTSDRRTSDRRTSDRRTSNRRNTDRHNSDRQTSEINADG